MELQFEFYNLRKPKYKVYEVKVFNKKNEVFISTSLVLFFVNILFSISMFLQNSLICYIFICGIWKNQNIVLPPHSQLLQIWNPIYHPHHNIERYVKEGEKNNCLLTQFDLNISAVVHLTKEFLKAKKAFWCPRPTEIRDFALW